MILNRVVALIVPVLSRGYIFYYQRYLATSYSFFRFEYLQLEPSSKMIRYVVTGPFRNAAPLVLHLRVAATC